MTRIVTVTALVVALAAGSFAGGAWWVQRSAAHAAAQAEPATRARCTRTTAATIPATARSAAWLLRRSVGRRQQAGMRLPSHRRTAPCR